MFENLDDPRKQALLMMAAGLLSPVRGKGMAGFGEALGQGLHGGLLGYNQGARTQEATRRGEMDRKLEQERLAQIQQQKAAQEYMGAGIKQFMQPGVTPATPVDDSGFAMPSSQPGFDRSGFAQYLAQNPATAMKAPEFLPQAAAPKWQIAPNGQLINLANPDTTKNYAAPKEAPFKPGQVQTYKAGRREITREYQPDGSWKVIGDSAVDKPDSGQRAAPQGYEWSPDGKGLRPIPGGPADAKVGKEAEAIAKRERGALDRADFVLGKVRESIDQTGVTTAGPLGAIARNIPGTGGYNLNKTVDAIKANIGFAELQAMREASPTGGALGQVAVQELNMLQSVLGSLDTAQSPDQLLKSLYAVEKHYMNWKRAVQQSKEAPQGGQADPLGLR